MYLGFFFAPGVVLHVAGSLCLAPRKAADGRLWPARVFTELKPACIKPLPGTELEGNAALAVLPSPKSPAPKSPAKQKGGKTVGGKNPRADGAVVVWVRFFGCQEEEAFECVALQARTVTLSHKRSSQGGSGRGGEAAAFGCTAWWWHGAVVAWRMRDACASV